MKNLAYKLYALSFNLCAHLPLQKKKVALLSPHMASFTDSLGDMEKEMQTRGYRIVRISGADIKPKKRSVSALCRMVRFFTKGAYDLATAGIVYLNDNFMPMADLHFHKKATVVQLWHAEGAFKRFGLDIGGLSEDVVERVKKGNARLDAVVCSSKGVVPVYASAFGVPEEKVFPLGSPRADRYIQSANSAHATQMRRALFGDTDKKIILYAPTFRDDPAENARLLDTFDFAAFEKRFGERYRLILRLHPQFGRNTRVPQGVEDYTGYPSANDLIAACDMVITDYSSICLDFALVDKPCVFYAFDLSRYCGERDFYFEYKNYVPGAVAETFEALMDALETAEADRDALHRFAVFNFDTPDGRSAERIADLAIRTANSK